MLPLAASAQTTQYASDAELDQIISEARAAGSQVLVIQPPPGEAMAVSEGGPSARDLAIAFSERLQVIFAARKGFFTHLVETVRGRHEGRWVMLTVFWTLVFVALGYAAEWLFTRWGRSYLKGSFNELPQSRAEKILLPAAARRDAGGRGSDPDGRRAVAGRGV